MSLKEFLKNKTGKPIIALCYRLPESNYQRDPLTASLKIQEAVQNKALRMGKQIGKINVETLKLNGYVYVKGWAEVLE